MISSFYFDPFCPLDENCFEKGRSFRYFQSHLHSFSDLAPVIWNQLPVSVHHSASVSSVKSSLKTFLFLKTSCQFFQIFLENLSLFKNLFFSPIALIYGCVCVRACVCVCVCVYTHACMRVWLYVCMCVCACMCVRSCCMC